MTEMEMLLHQVAGLEMLNQFWLSLMLIIPIVLFSRTMVAGTKYSPILFVVILGLVVGFMLNASGVATPGLPEFPLLGLISRVTLVALTVSFFVGGRKSVRFSARLSGLWTLWLHPQPAKWYLVQIVRSYSFLLGLFFYCWELRV